MAKNKVITIEGTEERELQDIELAKIIDLDWLVNTDNNFQPASKNNDKKRELEIQWGKGSGTDIGEDYPIVKPVTIMDEAKDLLKNFGKFVRKEMMKGKMGRDLVASIRNSFTEGRIREALPELKKILAYEGILGCIAIDARDYKDMKEAKALIADCPNKDHIKYVIMSKFDEKFKTIKKRKSSVSGEGADTIESFLNTTEKASFEEEKVCSETGLPVISFHEDALPSNEKNENIGDLSPTDIKKEDVDPIIDKMNFSENEYEKIRGIEGTHCRRISYAFRLAYLKSKREKFVPDKSAEYKMDSQFDIAVNERTPKDLDVDAQKVEGERLFSDQPEAFIPEGEDKIVTNKGASLIERQDIFIKEKVARPMLEIDERSDWDIGE